MKAYGVAARGGPENQRFLDLPVPTPGPDELLVRVRAAGVNPGDWRVRNGEGRYASLSLPLVLGREVAGTVEQLGPGVHGFAVGDEVFGGTPDMSGGWAELALVSASFASRRPSTVVPTDAAVLPVAAGTAYDALNSLDLPAGSTLLVNGAGGGVGTAMVQLAAARGLTVIGTASRGKRDLVASRGAVPVEHGPGVVERVRKVATYGVDAVFDTVGGEALRTVSMLVADRSRLVTIADGPGGAELGGRGVVRDRSSAVLAEVVKLVCDGVLDPGVTDVRPFEQAGEALAVVETGHARGKVAIEVS